MMKIAAATMLYVIAGVVSGASSASPVLSAVSDTARFSWGVPQGGLGSDVSFYTVSRAGVIVFVVFSDGMFLPLPDYRDRLVYQGNIAARNVTFTLSNIQTSDAGTYTCGDGSPSNVIQNCGQKLVVLGKPTTPGRPVSTTPVYNQQVTLTCSSTSTTVPADHGLTLTYTWQRDNTDITVTSPGSPYTFPVSSRDSHSYRCRARESQGLESEWSQGYNMEPQYGPYQISLTPSTSSYTVAEHQVLPSITCSALCRPGCSYRWLHNGTAFSNGATLSLGQADRSKTGSYRCQPSNTHGSSDSVTVSVDVQYTATVSMFTANSHGGSVTVNESDPLILRCMIDSNPRSVIRILNGTEELTRTDNSLTAEYRLESADCRQRGNYSCTATNNIGTPGIQRVELLVKCSPRLDETVPHQLKYVAILGGNVNVSVSVLAYPLPTFTWSRTTSTSQDLTGSSSPVSDISVTARLHLANLQQQDFGDYQLTVDNGLGRGLFYTVRIVSEAVNATTVGPTPPSSGTVERKDIECTAGTMDIHIPRTLLPTHNVTLRDPTCVVPSNGTHLVISISFNQCGTTVSFSNDTVVFSNELVATVIKASHPSSIVDYGLSKDDQRVSLECVYKRHSSVELNYMPMMRAAHFYEKRYGNLDFEVKRYTDEQFTTEIANTDIPTGVNLNSEIFIDLVVDQHQTKDIGIYVPSCFATPTPSPTDPLFYPLIRSSCPAQADVRRFTAPDINEFRFSFLAFKFTRAPMQKPHASMPAVPMVYIHCQVSACPRGNCTSSCNSANGGRMKRAALGDSSHLISTGPFFLKTDESTTGYSSIVVAVTMSVAVAATVVAMAAIVAWRRSASKLSAYKSLRLNMDS